MSFWTKAYQWMTESTSVIGTAVATPALAGVLSGQLSWQQAALPLLGAAVAIAFPQSASQPGPAAASTTASPVVPLSAVDLLKAGGDLALHAAGLLNLTGTRVGTIASVAVPAVVNTVEAAYDTYLKAANALADAQKLSETAANALTAAQAAQNSRIAMKPPVSPVPSYVPAPTGYIAPFSAGGGTGAGSAQSQIGTEPVSVHIP